MACSSALLADGRLLSSKMGPKMLLAILRLVRLPNIFTAMADVMAGYFLVFGTAGNLQELLLLMVSSGCIYGGGCALNDVCDFEIDRVERPTRPLPSGIISRSAALWISCVLLGGGLGAAALIGLQVLGLALFLVFLVVCYDCLTKNIPVLGSLTMAACRGANLLLGMMPGIYAGTILFLPLVSMCYVFGLTSVSKFETSATPERFKVVASGWILTPLVAVLGLVFTGIMKIHALVALAGLLLMIAPPLYGWFREAVPQKTGRAVKFLVLGIPLLDAVYVCGMQSWLLALPLIGCAMFAVATAKWMHVS